PCDDFELRQLPCKHIIAARLVCAREHDGKAPAIVTDTVPHKPTYKQNWPMYNEAQQTEKYRFQKLLFELCRGVPNLKQTGPGRADQSAAGPIRGELGTRRVALFGRTVGAMAR